MLFISSAYLASTGNEIIIIITSYASQRFGGHVGGKQTPDTIAVNQILLFMFLQHGRHNIKCKTRIF